MNAPYVQQTAHSTKTYDHDDIDNDMRSDTVLALMAHVLGALGVACALVASITIMLQVPDAWLSWIDLYLWGV